MVDIISIVNPGYQKAVQAAEKENTKPAETLDTEEKTEESEAAGSGKPNGDVYEPEKKDPAAEEEAGTSYKPNKKLVEELKAEQAQMQSRFVNMVKDMLGKQGITIAEGEGFWKFMASGEYKVDEETQKAAQEAIGEDGYWGVSKTSERIVGFAKALTGGNPEKIDLVKDAFIKGYEAAEKAWGGKLPDLSKDTYDAVMKLFDEWEKESKGDKTEDSEATEGAGEAAGEEAGE